MSKIAIDVALLLPHEISRLCIDINNLDHNAHSILNEKDNLPHITLAMAVIEEKDLEKVKKAISNLVSKPLPLEISELNCSTNPVNKDAYSFIIHPSKEIKNLHFEIMKNLKPMSSNDATKEMFYLSKGETWNDVSLYWVNNYSIKHSDKELYTPHISLKCKKAQSVETPIRFTATKVAICHLGNYCTCRKVFADFDL